MLGMLLIVAGLATGQPAVADDAELRAQASRLVRSLGADTLKDREQAEQQLRELGPAVLKYLPVPNRRMSNEQQTRLKRVTDELRLRQAVDATAGSTVTLKLDNVKLSEALKKLEEQSGNKFVDYRESMGQKVNDPEISLSVDAVPFWQAVDQLLAAAKLTVYPYATDDEGEPLQAVALVDEKTPGTWRRQYVAYDQAFRFEAIRILARRGLQDSDENRLRLEMEAAWEPRLRPISISIHADGMQAELGDADTPLQVVSSGQQSIDVYGGSTQFPVYLALPPRTSTQLKKVRGKLSALLPGRIESFRFNRLGNVPREGVAKKLGDVTATLLQVVKNGSVWEVRLRATFESEAAEELDSHEEGWVAKNEVYLESTDGKKTRVDVATTDDPAAVASESGTGFMFVLDEGDQISNYQLVYNTPAALVVQEVTFEFKDLPLP